MSRFEYRVGLGKKKQNSLNIIGFGNSWLRQKIRVGLNVELVWVEKRLGLNTEGLNIDLVRMENSWLPFSASLGRNEKQLVRKEIRRLENIVGLKSRVGL